jgi:nitric oxide dioxygenase
MLSLVHTHADPKSRRPVTWLHASKHGGDHAYREVLRGLGKDLTRRVWYESPRAEDRPLLGSAPDSAYHFEGLMNLKQVEELLPLGAHAQDAMYFFCGPPGWMSAVAAQLTELGVPKENLAFEFFGPADPDVVV